MSFGKTLKMKHFLLSIFIAFTALSAIASSSEYQRMMSTIVKKIDTTKQTKDFIMLASSLERKANEYKTEWLTHYYVAYCYIQASFNSSDKDQKGMLADKAIEIAGNALNLNSSESELVTLVGYAYLANLSSCSMLTSMYYAQKAKSYLEDANLKNPNNPRPILLMGTFTYYAPEFIGGGKAKALPVFNKALGAFKSFTPSSAIAPAWGKKACDYWIGTYKKE